jgi:hypothetical protein
VSRDPVYETFLHRRIRFLLPPVVAVGLMLCYLMFAADFFATTRQPLSGAVLFGLFEALLLWNVLARRRYQMKLNRLLANCCTHCGYDLRATPDGCPECGASVKTSA